MHTPNPLYFIVRLSMYFLLVHVYTDRGPAVWRTWRTPGACCEASERCCDSSPRAWLRWRYCLTWRGSQAGSVEREDGRPLRLLR